MNWLIAKAYAASDLTGEAVEHTEAHAGLFGDTYFWVAVALVAFFAVVWRAGGFKAGIAALDARVEKIKTELDEAETLRTEAQTLLAQYQRKHRDALREADEIVAHAKSEAERLREEAEAELKTSLERRRAQAMERIARAEAQAVEQVKAAAVDIAIEASRAVIADQLEKQGEAALIDQSIETLRGKLH